MEALHECLTWLRQPGNNKLCFYGAEMEAFDAACKRQMHKVKTIICDNFSEGKRGRRAAGKRKVDKNGSINW